jgi:hypothetical protein
LLAALVGAAFFAAGVLAVDFVEVAVVVAFSFFAAGAAFAALEGDFLGDFGDCCEGVTLVDFPADAVA